MDRASRNTDLNCYRVRSLPRHAEIESYILFLHCPGLMADSIDGSPHKYVINQGFALFLEPAESPSLLDRLTTPCAQSGNSVHRDPRRIYQTCESECASLTFNVDNVRKNKCYTRISKITNKDYILSKIISAPHSQNATNHDTRRL